MISLDRRFWFKTGWISICARGRNVRFSLSREIDGCCKSFYRGKRLLPLRNRCKDPLVLPNSRPFLFATLPFKFLPSFLTSLWNSNFPIKKKTQVERSVFSKMWFNASNFPCYVALRKKWLNNAVRIISNYYVKFVLRAPISKMWRGIVVEREKEVIILYLYFKFN